MTIRERFEANYIPEPMSGCWLWTGTISGGYGQIGVGSRSDGTRRKLRATRLALDLYCGPVPDDLHVLHRCDNKLCVNPGHLYAGTHSQNMKDAWDRGLKRPHNQNGASNGSSKLTEEQARMVKGASGSLKDIAAQFGVSKATVSLIKRGLRWSHMAAA